jgi:hypothetical protein
MAEKNLKRGRDKTAWPSNLMHTELCAWRFGGQCDCHLSNEEKQSKEHGC